MKLKNETYLPNTELGIVDDVIGHGELSLVLGRVNGFDLSDYAILRFKNAAVVFGDVGQDRND